jgi:isopentenyldiphosphate isomerase
MEIWDVLDASGNKTGNTVERGTSLSQGEYHLIVDVWIMNNKGEFLISRRVSSKYPDPGKWNPVCGCAMAGEDSISSALRETKEELGIDLDIQKGRLLKRFICGTESIIDVWLFNQEVDINTVELKTDETDDVIWASANAVKHMINNNDFVHPKRVPYVNELF